jgi:cytoskeletal protein CcmA (bactofilin family)
LEKKASSTTLHDGFPRTGDVRWRGSGRELQRMAQGDQINIIGRGITIRGSLTGGGDLVIEGRVEGQINLKNHLTIEGSGRVEADIRADELTINGEAAGNIDASTKVSINASAKVNGDIKAHRIVIEDGAVFNGSIDMEVKLPDDI